MFKIQHNYKLTTIINIAKSAGEKVLVIYQQDNFSVTNKADSSPVTQADLIAHQFIVSALQQLSPNIPIISEESSDLNELLSKKMDTYWLIDPLDGTKEFITRRGEFTINIALIDHGVPIIGVVYAPTLNACYFAQQNGGAFKLGNDNKKSLISVAKLPQKPLRVVVSHSHLSDTTLAYVDKLKQHHEVQLTPMGSSLKICLVAEGAADIYPRFEPTRIWDIAAADCILREAGGGLWSADDPTKRLPYNLSSLVNGSFIATAQPMVTQ